MSLPCRANAATVSALWRITDTNASPSPSEIRDATPSAAAGARRR
jgi:hypothetical protein